MNVQSKIIEGIKLLLHQQDYIVVPNFGGFVTQIHFSKYLVEKNILTPPGKIISFNKQLRQNDGVLVFWLQEQLTITSEVALKHVTEFSEYCQQVLNAKRRLSLEDLGFFYLDFENNICFEPKTDTNYLLDSFGLSPVILNELPVAVEEPKKQVEFVDRVVEVKQELPVKRKRNLRPLAYLALGGSILFFSLAALININKNEGPLLSGLFHSNSNHSYKAYQYADLNLQKSESEIKPYIANSNGIAVIALNTKSIAVSVTDAVLPTENSSEVNTNNSSFSSNKFQIVLGCFSLKDNALKMVKKLKKSNVKATIAGTNNKGMHVVSCAGFNSKEEATHYLSEIKGNFPTAWIKAEN
jgi:hypothetical protein